MGYGLHYLPAVIVKKDKDMTDTSLHKTLVDLLELLAVHELFNESSLPDVRFFRSGQYIPRSPSAYEPSIVIIGQGRKLGYLGDKVYTYDPYNYLVLSVPLPIECETFGSPQEPLLGVYINVNPLTVSELLLEMEDDRAPAGILPRGIYSTPLPEALLGATVRLLECLSTPLESKILGPQIIREIIYRVLCGEQGDILRLLASRQSRFGQIAKVLQRMHTEFSTKLDIGTLANEANMSVSSFHSNFKTVTASSPLQYLKSVRLHKARLLMAQDGFNASMAASTVGYESASQFSREFKRFFGNTPVEEASKFRAMIGP